MHGRISSYPRCLFAPLVLLGHGDPRAQGYLWRHERHHPSPLYTLPREQQWGSVVSMGTGSSALLTWSPRKPAVSCRNKGECEMSAEGLANPQCSHRWDSGRVATCSSQSHSHSGPWDSERPSSGAGQHPRGSQGLDPNLTTSSSGAPKVAGCVCIVGVWVGA